MVIQVRRLCASTFFILGLALLLSTGTFAQVDRGSIVGTVSDASGGRIADASVTVTNLDANQSFEYKTDTDGNYSAPLLKIGRYSVRVEKQGFSAALESNVGVGVNQVVRIDLTLKVGSRAETVEVTTAAPLLQTEASSLGTIETERRISDLPLNGRDFIQLAYLGPGANAGQTGSNVSGGVFENERANEAISVNGLRVTNNNFLLNGVDNNEFGLGGTVVLPPPDAIEEFRTEANSMSAEFGRGGAAVNVVIKSGTNQLHGGLYEFIRNDKLDAVNYFNQGQQPFKRNQFGAFAGAPIVKNKTFVFADYSGYRLRETDPFISSVPTALERIGDFSEWLSPSLPADQQIQMVNPYTGSPILGNRLDLATKTDGTPLLNQVGMNVLTLYPVPNLSGGAGPTFADNYLTTQDRMNDQDGGDIRVDHRFREEDQVFASYSINDVRSVRPGPLGYLGGSDCCPSKSDSRGQHLGLGYTHMFSTTLVNDLHGGYFRYAVNALPFNYGKTLGNDLGIPNANRGDINSSGLTNIDVGGYTPLGDSEWLPEHVFENIFQVADTLTWIKGRHSLKFGVDFRRQQRNFYQVMAPRGLFVFSGAYTGDPFADLATGIANATEQDFLQGIYPTRYWDLSEFVQDNFRLRSNLTLNIGLRYEVFSPANGRVSNFNLATGLMDVSYGQGAISHAGVAFDKGDIAPRIGLAWSVRKNTVVRSAFGMFYSSESNIFDDLGLNPPQDTFNAAQYSQGGNILPAQLISSGFPDAFPPYDPTNLFGSVKTTGPKRLIPRILEWNLTIQHQLAQNWVFQIGYVGTHAYRLWNHESSDLNQPLQPSDNNFCGPDLSNCISGNYGRPYYDLQPNLVSILPLDYAQLHTMYNALQTSLNKQFSNGFNLLVAYTYSKNLGNADGNVGTYIQNSHDPGAEYGPAAPDLRHRLSISYLYELPVGHGRRFLPDINGVGEAIVGGWQVAGITTVQSGEAETAVLSFDPTNTGSFSPRPDMIAKPNDFSFNTTGQQCSRPGHQTLDCWYNQAAFAIPGLAPGQSTATLFGNSPIGNLRGPDLINFDFVLQKDFKIREAQRLQFRAEFFNILNHPNFGLPGVYVDAPGGAAITNTATDNRQIEFALKYTF
jgi:Carboxypeptidase regulatory-like domain